MKNKIEIIESKQHGLSMVITRFGCGTVGLVSVESGKMFTRMAGEIENKKTF